MYHGVAGLASYPVGLGFVDHRTQVSQNDPFECVHIASFVKLSPDSPDSRLYARVFKIILGWDAKVNWSSSRSFDLPGHGSSIRVMVILIRMQLSTSEDLKDSHLFFPCLSHHLGWVPDAGDLENPICYKLSMRAWSFCVASTPYQHFFLHTPAPEYNALFRFLCSRHPRL